MSNHLAIATVTSALKSLLSEAVENIVSGGGVTVGRPEEAGSGAGGDSCTACVNIFLFQVSPNTHWRNHDLPTRSMGGVSFVKPQAALDLYYLLTFTGEEKYLEPQRLLGAVVSTLHARPLLTTARIKSAIEDALDEIDPDFHYIQNSDLAAQIEKVRFTQMDLNLEELSKLWSVFFQVPYALSVAYKASVVLIESEDETPRRALPVKGRNVYAVPFQNPAVEAVVSTLGDREPIFFDSSIFVRGARLRAENTLVRIGGQDITPDAGKTSMEQIEVALPSGLFAGIQQLRVLHQQMMGTPAELHDGFASNVFPFVLHPKITVSSATALAVTVSFSPAVGRDQRVVLMLNEFNAPAARAPFAYLFDAPQDNGITDPTVEVTAGIAFPISGVESGTYLVRVQVDGAESVLSVDSNPASPTYNLYTGPQAAIP